MRFIPALFVAILVAPLLASCASQNGGKEESAEVGVKTCEDSAGHHETDKAIALCDSALARTDLSPPLRSRALAARGVAYGEKHDYTHAIADLSEALNIEPDNMLALLNRGWAYNQVHEFDRAITDLDKVIARSPNANAFANRSFALNWMGEFDLAIRDLDAAIRLDPHGAARYNDRGWTHMMLGDMTAALADMNRAIELDSNLGRVYENRSTVYFLRGEYPRAIEDVEQAIRRTPANAFGYIWLYIMTRRNHGDPAAALKQAVNASNEWPAVILRFIEGQGSEQAVHDAVGGAAPGVAAFRDCHTETILGELALLDGRKTEAADHFRNASHSCPRGQSERIIAELELKRM